MTDEQKNEAVRTMWSGDASCAEIGQKLRLTKHAVTGRAHRMKLPARPSPIKRDGRGGPTSNNGGARPPMSAGDPISWGAITAGTCLEGSAFDDA